MAKNDNSMENMRLTNVSQQDPLSQARELQLWQQAQMYAGQRPFSQQYVGPDGTSAVPGFTGLQSQAQDYLGSAIFGNQYSPENLGFTGYTRPEGVAGSPSFAFTQNQINPSQVDPWNPAPPPVPTTPGAPPPVGPWNPPTPPPPVPGGPPGGDPSDPPVIGGPYVPTPPGGPTVPPPTTVKPSPGDVNVGMGGALYRDPSLAKPTGFSSDPATLARQQAQQAQFMASSQVNPVTGQREMIGGTADVLGGDRTRTASQMAVPTDPMAGIKYADSRFGYAKAPAGPDFMPQPMPQPSPDIMPQPVGPLMPETPIEIAPPPPPAPPISQPSEGQGYLRPGEMGTSPTVGLNPIQLSQMANRRMLEEAQGPMATTSSIFDDPRTVEDYMNRIGVDAQRAQAQDDYERIQNQIQATQAGTGAFASTNARGELQNVQAGSDHLRNLAAIEGAGYRDAAAAMREAAAARTDTSRLNVDAATEFRRQQAALADQYADLGLREQGATFAAGDVARGLGQDQRDVRVQQAAQDYEQWLRGQQGGAEAMALMRGMLPGAGYQTYERKPSVWGQIGAFALNAANTASRFKNPTA
jgi:hypothetical protein